MIAGTIGGGGRLEYTVIGDAVNVAQRLQSEAEGGEIVASASTVAAAPGYRVRVDRPAQREGPRGAGGGLPCRRGSGVTATATASRPSRWPWIVLALAGSFAAVGLVFVRLNGYSLLGDSTNFIAFMGMGVVGALSLSRAPDNRIGWLLLWVAVTVGAAFTTGEASIYAAAHGWPAVAWLAWPGNSLWAFSIFPLLIILPLVFPDGRLPSSRWRWLFWAGIGISFLAFVSIGFADATFEVGAVGQEVRVANPLHVPALGALAGIVDSVVWPMLLVLFVVAVGSMVVRFRRSSGVERQQLKWFAFAAVVLMATFLVSAILAVFGIPEGTWSEVVSGLAFLGIPVAVGIAILQFHLWDLDVVVRKAVVAGMLVVLAVVVYGGAVALIAKATADRGSTGALFAVALALGIAFRPVMRIARRFADRIAYGTRATPYEVLSEFSDRMRTSYATEDVLPRMAQVLGEGTGATTARVWLLAGNELRPTATWPADAPPAAPVRWDGGSSEIARRSHHGGSGPRRAPGGALRSHAGLGPDESLEGQARERPGGAGRHGAAQRAADR